MNHSSVSLFIVMLALGMGAPQLPAAPSAAAPSAAAPSAAAPTPTFTDPSQVDASYALQGEYTGTMRDAPFAMQVIAKGHGQFDATLCPGGLPGAGWSGEPSPRQKLGGKLEGEGAEASVRFSGNGWSGVLSHGAVVLQDFKGTTLGTLRRCERQSTTMGAQAPPGAVVVFDGKSVASFQNGARMTNDGLLMEGCTTKEEFGDCSLHLEFRLAYMPEASNQGRSNSGLYLASRYEVQMLDSFGLNGANNECGGIYTIAKPLVNMCLPPLQWQTYDIDYTAPRFDDKGLKTTDAQATVKHNGVLIQDKVNLPHPTTSAPVATEGSKGPLHLQNHGCPVRFRNFWVVKK
jgi:hypothetical protein